MSKSGLENRILIIKIIRDFMDSSSSSSLIYSNYFKSSNLSYRDKRFVTEVTKGTIRMSRRIDDEINYYCKSKIEKFEKLYLIILRSAVYQINYMDKTPNYAIISTSVDIVKRYFPKYSKLTNAILRNIARKEYSLAKPDKNSKIKDFSIYYSHPDWIVEKWLKDFGYSCTVEILESNNRTPQTWFRYNENKIKFSSIKEVLSKYKQSVSKYKYLSNFFSIDNPSTLLNDEIFFNGYISVQSPTNGMIVNLLDPMENEEILDICAAPGSKTVNIAERVGDSGKIISYDINPRRIKFIKDNLIKNKIKNVQVLRCDASKEKLLKTSKMIIDVPCSGTGTIAKNADLRWKKSIDDISNLSKLQEQILHNCSKHLKPNGVLVYSTCSIEKEENWIIIDKFLKKNPNYYIDNASKYVNAKFVDSRGAINMNPSKHNIDGGFAVRLIKHDS